MTYLVLSTALCIIGVTSLSRDRSLANGSLAIGASFIVGALSVILWPAASSLAFDTATHIAGLGRLVNDLCATLAVVLQFIFITSLAKDWCRWRRIALAVYGSAAALFVVLWIVLHGTVGRDLARVLYAGYAAGPFPVRVWNTIVAATILSVCVPTFVGYLRARGRIRNRYPQLTVLAGMTTYAIASLYGALIIAQVIVSWLGGGDIGIRRYLGPIVVVCLVAVVGNGGFVLFARRLGTSMHRGADHIRRWLSLTEKQTRINRSITRLEQLLDDNIAAASVAIDQRVYLDEYADGALIDAADEHLQAYGIAPYRRKVARQALRYLVLNRANAARALHEDNVLTEDGDDPILDDDALLADLARQEQVHIALFADAAHLASLVILLQRGEDLVRGRLSELAPHRDLDGWRREVAALIVDVLRAHERNTSERLYVERRRGPRGWSGRKEQRA